MALENHFQMLLVPGLFLLLHLAALILALVYYRRCPAACGLVITASIMNLAVTVARLLVQFFPEMPMVRLFTVFAMINWVAYGLMLVAVFVGRNQPAPTPFRDPRQDDDDDWDQPPAPPPTNQSTGIQISK
jgi:hypothetical protein